MTSWSLYIDYRAQGNLNIKCKMGKPRKVHIVPFTWNLPVRWETAERGLEKT